MRTPFRKRRLTCNSQNISIQQQEEEQQIQRWTEDEQQEEERLTRRESVSSFLSLSKHVNQKTLFFLLISPSFAQETDTPPTTSINESPSIQTVKQIIAYALITIAILSLFGWGYVFYLRCKYHQQQDNNDDKCCVDLEKGVKLNTPPRARARVKHSLNQNTRNAHHRHEHTRNGNSIDGRFDFSPQETKIEPHPPLEQSYMSNSTYQPDEEESQDSFARELSNAARQDILKNKQTILKKKVNRIHTSKRDNEPIHDSSVFDVLGWKQHGTTTAKKEANTWGFNFDSAVNFFSPTSQTSSMDMPSPPVSYLPSSYTQKQTSFAQKQSLEISDPGDVLLSDSSESSLWQSSTDGSDVFEYKKTNDRMGQYLLEDDESELEIVQDGISVDPSTVSIQTESTLGIGKGAQKRGFYTISNENDAMEEYIPKEEYDAAVMAAQHVLKHSPRNSPNRMQHLQQIPSIEPLPSAPSDERQSRRNLNIEQQSDVLATSYEEDSVSFSYDPSFQTSLDTSSSGHLSKDIYKELKEVSKFIQKYEKKHSKSDKSELSVGDFNDSSTFDVSAVQSMSMSQPSLTMTSASASESETPSKKKKKFAKLPFGKKKKSKEVEMEVSEMEVKVKSKKKKRKKKFGKLPPRPHSSHVKMQDEDEDEGEDQLEIEDHANENDDDDVIVMSNPYRPNSVNQRRQLPVADSGKYPAIGLSPSGESAASDAKFLHGEIDAFFTSKDTSMSIMSESIEVMHNPPGQSRVEKQSRFASRMMTPNKPPVQRPLQDPATTSQSSRFAKRMTPSKPAMKQKPIQDSIEEYDDSFDQDEDEIPHNSTFNSEGDPNPINESNRLGAAPFNANEYRARSNRLQVETELPAPKAVQVKTQRKEKSRIASPILSSPKDTRPVYGTNTRTSSPINVPFNNSPSASPIAQSARSMIQNGAKSFQNMIDRSRNTSDSNLDSSNDVSDYNVNRRNTRVADLENKLQSGARSFLSMFETKASDEAIVGAPSKDSPSRHRKSPSYDQKMTERIANRLEQIRQNVKGSSTRERSSSPSVNRMPSAPSSPERNSVKNSNTMHPMGSTREMNTRQVMQMFDSSEEEPSPIRRNNRVQVATFVEPDQVLSPNVIQKPRRERQVGRIYKPEIVMDISQQSQQSGDDTTESPSRLSRTKEYNSPKRSPLDREFMYEHTLHRNSERAASVTGGSVASSSAQNLISMFESKQYSKNAIFPQSENWQHNGTFRKDKGAYRR
ncbi:predicted protein [Chaetoceros tenuissimus]|uniref:Uncharacterized protein n=1 Tax=Chaetoceros tenuissimus TaxID=426638 RepID=A0AAD3CDZ8_9STRA|nr:predicted protein [Chaetoceros tenuissimus]